MTGLDKAEILGWGDKIRPFIEFIPLPCDILGGSTWLTLEDKIKFGLLLFMIGGGEKTGFWWICGYYILDLAFGAKLSYLSHLSAETLCPCCPILLNVCAWTGKTVFVFSIGVWLLKTYLVKILLFFLSVILF